MPIISLQGKTILFIHVPKTGGKALQEHLSQHGEVHFRRGMTKGLGIRCIPGHFHGTLLESLFHDSLFDHVFMVVRHPFSRTVSDYRYYVRRKKREENPPDFSRWLRYRFFRASRNPYYMDNHFRPQCEFECFNVSVYRFENGLSACIRDINTKFGTSIPEELPRVNESPPIEVNLTDSAKRLIYHRYRKDFRLYGYPAN